jgi:acetyl-CoA C-acetyltransferase
MGSFDAVAVQAHPEVGRQYVHHAGNSSGIIDGAAAVLISAAPAATRNSSPRPHPRVRQYQWNPR